MFPTPRARPDPAKTAIFREIGDLKSAQLRGKKRFRKPGPTDFVRLDSPDLAVSRFLQRRYLEVNLQLAHISKHR
jgi:hypothetical protein